MLSITFAPLTLISVKTRSVDGAPSLHINGKPNRGVACLLAMGDPAKNYRNRPVKGLSAFPGTAEHARIHPCSAFDQFRFFRFVFLLSCLFKVFKRR